MATKGVKQEKGVWRLTRNGGILEQKGGKREPDHTVNTSTLQSCKEFKRKGPETYRERGKRKNGQSGRPPPTVKGKASEDVRRGGAGPRAGGTVQKNCPETATGKSNRSEGKKKVTRDADKWNPSKEGKGNLVSSEKSKNKKTEEEEKKINIHHLSRQAVEA